MTPADRYLRTFGFVTMGLLAAVALFNLVVDPYGVFRLVSVGGFNRIKSQAGQRATLYKRHALEQMRPNALVLGNSRAEIGFDPDSPAWPAHLQPVFNLALPGASVASTRDEFTRALRTSAPRFVLLGVDFLDFRVEDGAEATSAAPPPGATQWLRERVLALLTMDALVDSLATIRAQHQAYPTSLTDAGFNPMRDYVAIARSEGYYAMFRQRDQENARAYQRGTATIHRPDGQFGREFDTVDEVIDLCVRHGIALRLVVYPYHAHTLVLFRQAGLWPAFEAWKRELARRVDGVSAQARVELWDFSGFSPYAEESVPPPGDVTSEMRWYWEGGHFKQSLGELMLARLFDPARPAQWGERLTSANVEQALQRDRSAGDAYVRGHAADVDALARIIAATRVPRASPAPAATSGATIPD